MSDDSIQSINDSFSTCFRSINLARNITSKYCTVLHFCWTILYTLQISSVVPIGSCIQGLSFRVQQSLKTSGNLKFFFSMNATASLFPGFWFHLSSVSLGKCKQDFVFSVQQFFFLLRFWNVSLTRTMDKADTVMLVFNVKFFSL